MNIIQQINILNDEIRIREMSDDGYYLSLQYKEDKKRLHLLKTALKKENV